jgi:hypothetical protein
MSDPYAQPSSNPPPQPTGYPGPEFPPPPAASTNGFAVAALVFGILGGLLGLVFGIIALVQIRRTGQKGTGLAVAGLVLSALWLLALGLGLVLLLAVGADRDAEGEITEGEVYATFDLPEGDYPGETAIVDQAEAECDERLSAVAPDAYADPSVGLFYLAPLEASWPDDREVVCIAISMSGTTTGSILD